MPEPSIRRYRYTDLASVHHGVVVSQPGSEGPVTVYVPPIGDELPYEREFVNWPEAEQFALVALQQVAGSDTYVATKHHVGWWRINLIPVEEDGSS